MSILIDIPSLSAIVAAAGVIAGSIDRFADPHAKVGFAYVPNRTDTYLMDPRQNALRLAMYRSIGETNPFLLREEG